MEWNPLISHGIFLFTSPASLAALPTLLTPQLRTSKTHHASPDPGEAERQIMSMEAPALQPQYAYFYRCLGIPFWKLHC